MATEPTIEIVTRHPDVVGECPTWDQDLQSLLWTDNRSERVYRYTSSSSEIETVVEGHAAYAFTLQQDGSLLLFMNNTRIAHGFRDEVTTVVENLPGEQRTRFNDVLVDRRGRIICGVLPTEGVSAGSLYSLAEGGEATKLHGDLMLPNGMAFSPDDRLLYVADTRAKHVLVFDYDLASGGIENMRTFATFDDDDAGAPDGVTVDVEGGVWVAATGSWSVSRYDPSGTLDRRVRLEARKPTSVGFGGDDMATLYVTSSSREASPGDDVGPMGGALFALKPGVKGQAEHRTNWRL
jgi:sugar lactone lactonase YvrE